MPGSRRHYLQFPAGSSEGESGYFVAAQLPLYRNSPNRRFYLTRLTDRVLEDYAKKLLPRAVGYSASLINHFFRGRIQVSAPDRFVYGRALYEEGNTSKFQTLHFKVANASPTGQETSSKGELWAVVQYRTSSANLFEDPGAPISADFVYAVAGPAEVELSRTPQEVRVDFEEAGGVPANAADVRLIVVYQGPLGGEPDAVLVGTVDLAEPHPIDFFNATDYDCVDQQPYYVGNLAADDSARDVDGDGTFDLLGPYRFVEQHWKVSEAPGSVQYPNSVLFDFFVPESRVVGGATVAGGFTPTTRYVTLHDGEHLWKALRNGEEWDQSETLQGQDVARLLGASPAIVNETFRDTQGNLVRRYSPAGTYRGITGFTMAGIAAHRDHFVAYCFYPLRNAPPDLTRIPGTLAPVE